MQISTSSFYDRSTSLMNKLSAKSDLLQTQISTQTRLQGAADDVVAYKRLAGMKQASADDLAYSANIKLGQSVLAQADSTLDGMSTQLQRAKELAVRAGSDTLSASDRKVIATELRSVLDDMAALANTRDMRGQPLFGAATGDTAVTQASDGSVTFTGTGEPAPLPIGNGTSIQATDSAQRVFGFTGTDGTATDVFATVKRLADALEAGGGMTEAPKAAQDDLSLGQTQLTSARGSLGARAARLELDADQMAVAVENREVARSDLEDTDITSAIAELQKTITTLQATQASFTKLSSLSLFDYLK
ncbi:flagellar hook-associated protein FlgL [Sphingomonas aracearum]|uniref:Flagellar hook-associated protein 3 n=1 Tax=Sphingomonas aracearum TaxID=2283317 RepID=A0A369VU11_9SPHN|nr:flagellar hook-associated protein FlgL [Sphingomonas aracearum]RDE05874.1 flagellar hook-associated protein 3 [Sphingomonas aracearum]